MTVHGTVRQLVSLATLRAAVNRIIPADNFPAGWEGGVADHLVPGADSGLADAAINPELDWALAALCSLGDRLDDAVGGGLASFSRAPAAEQDRVLSELGQLAEAADELATLLRISWEGFYAPSEGRDPAGPGMVGFRSLPEGVEPVEPELLPTITVDQLRGSYDAVIIGSGPGGASAARVLTERGKNVLIVERALQLSQAALRDDHLHGKRTGLYNSVVGPGAGHPRVIENADGDEVVVQGDGSAGPYGLNAMTVGGGTRLWQGMAWRFMPEDFAMATTYGVPEGTSLADWPVDYAEMEPYYGRAEDELGVAGEEGGLTSRTPRSRPYPLPAMESEPAREVLGAAADRLGWRWGPVPLALNSIPHDGRPACVKCAQCVGHACPVNAKSGAHNTLLPRAINTGSCDFMVDAQAIHIEDGVSGARVQIVADASTTPQTVDVTASVVVVAAGAVETPRLIAASGLGNDQVGRHLHDHSFVMVLGNISPGVKSFRGPGHSIATLDHVHSSQSPWGGGVIFDLNQMLPVTSAGMAGALGHPAWGSEHKEWMREGRQHMFGAFGIGQEIPMASSRVEVSSLAADRWGQPVARLRKEVHSSTREVQDFMSTAAAAWLREAGANDVKRLAGPAIVAAAGEHSCGTMRMGSSSAVSATAPTGRVWGTRRVYACDSSLHPTNGSVNPTLTIFANALRVAGHIADALH
ncbi:glucose-methanol-choline oxidoreductase [Salinibacterium sp. UTAS2018]|uniref:GMC family oxidoreductase N-terminal domain-containing protein n=1 Tax=unclassified Salinibacterium TaxID=2632331 RepID=UPI0010097451|nr:MULTISPECIES: GMC family oxidoreductase N-terminal domain-containing protein [unclassified Salinibacterium]MBH0009103.1 GMC family oxidoreductase N-terminal domain-containing protein [Salinibacterium sp. SWN1162]QAV69664.1 glucose-methanol-choline oxidoreductase [Salinibacterium sp. UTAS2018]